MLPDAALRTMNVLFATPCYISAVTMNYVTSMFSLSQHAAHFGLNCELHMHSESLITRGRNIIVLKFLKSEKYTHLFFIDSDIIFTPQSVCRLLLADRDVCAGIYPIKRLNWPEEGLPEKTTLDEFQLKYNDYAFNPVGHRANNNVGAMTDGDGFVEVAEAPTGFMCIKRKVFYDMMKFYPHLNYTPDGPPGHPDAHLHWRFFDCMVDPDSGRYLSEDWSFCRLWRDMGNKVWVDPNITLGHLGQFIYNGNLKDTLTRNGHWPSVKRR